MVSVGWIVSVRRLVWVVLFWMCFPNGLFEVVLKESYEVCVEFFQFLHGMKIVDMREEVVAFDMLEK